MNEKSRPLDEDALALFRRKGREGGPEVPQAGEANAVKVRRVLQLTADLAGAPLERLRILDLGCGEGVYAIEAALAGARVVAIDARTGRMDEGAAVAERHGLANLRFVREDVRNATADALGEFDVVWMLGILYHLDAPDVLEVIENVAGLCRGLLVVDTLIAAAGPDRAERGGRSYEGRRVREHGDDDPPDVRRARPLPSIDNTWSFRFTRDALVRALGDAGFTSVLEAHAPLEPGRAPDRITLVARPGTPVRISTYPFVNDLAEEEIADRIGAGPAAEPGLSAWIARLYSDPTLLRMGHNQRAEDLNLGLGWLYYALGRILRYRTAVVIGSWRGFVPLVLARALADNVEDGEVVFIDPSMVDDQWAEPERVRRRFLSFGLTNVRHHPMTTQQFVESAANRDLGEIGLLFVDGYHTAEQVRFDYRAFADRIAPHGIVLFHDSMIVRTSTIYGSERAYEIGVAHVMDELRADPALEVLNVPYGNGLTMVRSRTPESLAPRLEGEEARPK